MPKKPEVWNEQTLPLDNEPTPPGNIQVDGSAVHVNRPAERRADLEAQIAELQRQENREVPGAPVLTPKGDMLRIPDELRAANPESHFRFIATKDPNKVAQRKAEGYQILSESEGGRRLGDGLALAKLPKERAAAREAAQQELNRARLAESKRDVERVAEAVARELRDRHGLNIPVKRLLVDE